jgi:hypothetical protein
MFLNFIEPSTELKYKKFFDRLCTRMTIPAIFLVTFTASARAATSFFRRDDDMLTQNKVLFTSFLVFLVALATFILYITAQILLVFFNFRDGSKQKKIANYIVYKAMRGELQSFIQLLSAIGPGLYMTAITIKGSCNNGFAASGHMSNCVSGVPHSKVPNDQILLTFLLPTCVYILAKGCNKSIGFLSWMISMGFVAGNIIYFKDWNVVWNIIYGWLFLVMMYEYERTMRIYYLKCEAAVDDDQIEFDMSRRRHLDQLEEEKHRHKRELENAELRRRREEADKELEQFRKVISLVALDLKTPLQAIFMDLEALREMTKQGVFIRTTGGEAGAGGRSSSIVSSVRGCVGTGVPTGITNNNNHTGGGSNTGGGAGSATAAATATATAGSGTTTPGIVVTGRRQSGGSVAGGGNGAGGGGKRDGLRTGRRRSSVHEITPHDVIASLFASFNFLHMAVNRCVSIFFLAKRQISLLPILCLVLFNLILFYCAMMMIE